MPSLWLRDTSAYIQDEPIVPQLFHTGVWAIRLGRDRKGLFETHLETTTPDLSGPTSHTKSSCASHAIFSLPAGWLAASDTWAQDWGGILPWATSTEEVQEQHNTETEPN